MPTDGTETLTVKMAGFALDFKNCVLYVCSCSQKTAIDDLYFCRHCKVPRCNDCVSTVIDNSCVSCPHCFEAVPQADTKSKRNRCGHCFQCPLCGSTLTARFVVVANELAEQQTDSSHEKSQDDKEKTPSPEKRFSMQVSSSPLSTPPKSGKLTRASLSGSSLKSPGTKFYYLSCTHCRWSTRDVGIADKRSPLDFKDKPHPFQDRFAQLLSHYKILDAKDRSLREQIRKQQSGRRVRSYSGLLDSSKLKQSITESLLTSPQKGDKPKPIDSVAKDPEPLSDDFYTLPVQLEKTTTIEQRLRDPTHQPSHTCDLWPRPLSLIGKKLHRCRGCDHILLKADVNLNSIRFKIHQLALHSFPRVRVMHLPKLTIGEPTIVPISFTNPMSHPLKLSFGFYSDAKLLKEKVCIPVLPEGEFVLTASEYIDDIIGEGDGNEEDNTFILSQEPGKLVLKFGVISETSGIDSKIVFLLRFSYKSSIESEKENPESTVKVPVLLNCGRSE